MASNQQPPDRQLDAAAYVKQFLAEQQQQQMPAMAAAAQQQPTGEPTGAARPPMAAAHPAQFLNQYLASGGGNTNGGNAGPLPPQQAGLGGAPAGMPLERWLADYYLSSSQAGGPTGPVAAPDVAVLPPNLMANLQAQHAHLAAPAPMAPRHLQALSLPQQQTVAAPRCQQPQHQQQLPHVASNAAQQHLLASAQLLLTVNPGLAAAAMAQALAMANNQQNNVMVGAPQQHHNPAAGAPPQGPTFMLNNQNQASVVSRPQQNTAVVAQPSHQMPSLHQSSVPQPSQHYSAGAAVAQTQYRQVHQHSQGPQVGIHSNRASPAMSQHHQMQQKRPSLIAASAITKLEPSAMVRPVSGSSINTGNSNTKPTQALSAVSAAAAVSSNKEPSPRNMPMPAQSSIKSASLPTAPRPSSGGAHLSKSARLGASGSMDVAKAAAIHHRHHSNAAVAALAVPSNSAAPRSKPSVPHVPITTMQRWSLNRLDAHVKQLKEASQTIPQAVTLLVADMRCKEEKRLAKRLANRKSACTSRARKKALIEEMTKDNARLRRQALILSYLPDPVVAISADGVITFCSMQVERVLRHEVSGLIGANIEDIIVPSSRESIRGLIRDLIIAEQQALSSSVEEESGERSEANGSERENNSASAALPHEVSEHSSELSFPPLLEVKVKAGQTSTEVAAGEDVSDSSGDPPSKNGQAKSGATAPTDMSSLTHKNSSFGPGESSEDQQPSAKKAKTAAGEKKSSTESDESTSSENKANANLTKNVEMCKLNKDLGAEQVRFSHTDDVMGASVTANNADAKLSSLMHHPREEAGANSSAKKPEAQVASIRLKHVLGPKMAAGKQEEQSSSSVDSSLSKTKKRSGNSSEDSGYRESNESPEESNEYPDDSSSSSGISSERSSTKKRRRSRPLAPACNVRLIRNDLSTIWCELTSSIRTRPSNDVDKEFNIVPPSQLKGKNGSTNESVASSESGEEEKELLLCFRPIREGEAVGEELRFSPNANENEKTGEGSDGQASSEDHKVSSANSSEDQKLSSNNSTSSKDGDMKMTAKKDSSPSADAASSAETQSADPSPSPPVKKNRPPKKRKFASEQDDKASKYTARKMSHSDETQVDEPDEKSAVESMMELAKNRA